MIDECSCLLDEDEQARASRLLNDEVRLQFLVAHAALRLLLSRFLPIRPADWRFERTPGGKPVVSPSLGVVPLHFNISHTRGAVACAVSPEGPVGIDIESVLRPPDVHFYRALFSANENAELAALTGAAQTQRFYAIWTAKEAYAKAGGTGISEALSDLTIESAESTPRLSPNSGNWQLDRLDAGTNHHAAFARQSTGPIIVRRFATAALFERRGV